MHGTVRLAPLLLALAPFSTGCIKAMLINGQIEGTREAAVAFDDLADFELAARAVSSHIAQFEGMHRLAPGNTDALFLLTKAWTGYAYGFAEDDLERAEDDGPRELAEYHKKRVIAGYDRAIQTGLELLGHRAEGFDDAKKTEAGLKAWLAENFDDPEDAEELFWPGYAWVERVNLMKDDAEAVADLWIGVALVERSVALDPAYNNHAGTIVLAGYHARSSTAELEESKTLFEEALAKTGRKSLIVQFNYATKYACARVDNALYTQLLNEVLTTEDTDPSLRLTNAIARIRAKRWLAEKRMFDACGMDPVQPQS